MAIRIPTRSSPRGRREARSTVRLPDLTGLERATLGSLIVIAVHAANTAAGAAAFGAGVLALAGLAGLGRLFLVGGRARRIAIAGGAGLGALVMISVACAAAGTGEPSDAGSGATARSSAERAVPVATTPRATAERILHQERSATTSAATRTPRPASAATMP